VTRRLFIACLGSLAYADTVNRGLALWKNIYEQLTGPNGREYFESSMRDALVPDGADGVRYFDATLISAEPPGRPSKLLVSVVDHRTPDAMLRLKSSSGRKLYLRSKPKTGTRIQFEGVATEFAESPFMVTFDVRVEQIKGLEPDKSHQRK